MFRRPPSAVNHSDKGKREAPTPSMSEDSNAETSRSATPPTQEGRTVTVFICGTCSNRDDLDSPDYIAGETINHLYSITEGEDYIDKIIVDGVGSGEKDTGTYWVPYKKYSENQGVLYGKGIEERLQHILAVLKNTPDPRVRLSPEAQAAHERLKNMPPITKVNIVGWSRGGAASIALAHRMAKDPLLNHIKVNLTILDPVAGFGLTNKENTHLLGNVEQCLAFYPKHEISFGFSCIVPGAVSTCNFIPFVMPGGHAQVTGSRLDHAQQEISEHMLSDVGFLTRTFMEHALTSFGTKLNPERALLMPMDQILRLYQAVIEEEKGYHTAATRVSYTTPQKSGVGRKAIHGTKNWFFNEILEEVLEEKYAKINEILTQIKSRDVQESETNENKQRFLDTTHEFFVAIGKYARGAVNEFSMRFNEHLERGVLSIDDVADLNNFWNDVHENIFLILAICNELQLRYQPDHRGALEHQVYTKAKLRDYTQALLHNLIHQHQLAETPTIEIEAKTQHSFVPIEQMSVEQMRELIEIEDEPTPSMGSDDESRTESTASPASLDDENLNLGFSSPAFSPTKNETSELKTPSSPAQPLQQKSDRLQFFTPPPSVPQPKKPPVNDRVFRKRQKNSS